jgi:SAM-dependent methyltransferase
MEPLSEAEAQARRQRLLAAARETGEPYHCADYFAAAEADMETYWTSLIWPVLARHAIDFACTLDLAAGHGRNTEVLRRLAERVLVVDMIEECVEACRARFADDPRVTCIQNDGISLASIGDGEVTFVYCFDSMVHFDSDVVRAYLAEFRRVLRPGGHGFCHHSNYSARPGGHFTTNPHWRNFMSCELFAHYCDKEGLEVLHQQTVDWAGDTGLDGFTVLQRPVEAVRAGAQQP